jgi:hypothetical protein
LTPFLWVRLPKGHGEYAFSGASCPAIPFEVNSMSPVHITIVVICIITMVVSSVSAQLMWFKIREEVNKTRPLEQQIALGDRFLGPFEQHRQMRLIGSEYRKMYPTGRLIQRHIICLYCGLAALSILVGYFCAGAALSNKTGFFAGMGWEGYLAGIAGAVFFALFGSLIIRLHYQTNFPAHRAV